MKLKDHGNRCDLWLTGNAKEEAKTLARLIGNNGDTIETLRELISVSPAEEAELRTWTACSPSLARTRIDNKLRFRAEVLEQLERLVSSGVR